MAMAAESELESRVLPPPDSAGRVRRPMRRLPTQSPLWAAAFLGPFLTLLAVFQGGPILAALYNSLRAFSPLGDPLGFAGLANYQAVLTTPETRDALLLMLGFAGVKVVLQLALGIAAALLVMQQTWFTTLVRSVVFLPTATAIVVVTLMFAFLFDRELGLVDATLAALGLPRVAWLLDPHAAQAMILVLSLWRDTGFVMLVFLSGLQAVPPSAVEAARIDGAGAWAMVRHVVAPLLARSFQFAAVFSVLATVRLVAPIEIMTRGGPRHATDIAAYHVYETAFAFADWGQSSALALLMLLLLLLLAAGLMALLRPRWDR